MAQTTPGLHAIVGKHFTAAHGKTYGTIRELHGNVADHPASSLGYIPFAEVGCGNAFVQASDGSIRFWDHETDEVLLLEENWSTFVAGCHVQLPLTVEPQVESVWVDPEFAKKFGL
jgi:hypothetical protein